MPPRAPEEIFEILPPFISSLFPFPLLSKAQNAPALCIFRRNKFVKTGGSLSEKVPNT